MMVCSILLSIDGVGLHDRAADRSPIRPDDYCQFDQVPSYGLATRSTIFPMT